MWIAKVQTSLRIYAVSPESMLFGHLTLVLLARIYPTFANSVDPNQLASEEANWSGSALFAIKYVNL